MVINRVGGPIGFIFQNDNKTIAHELGHGLFALEHTENDNSLGKAEGDLMGANSTGSTKLYKYQWSQVQNPPGVWGRFESGDDGEFSLPILAPNGKLLTTSFETVLCPSSPSGKDYYVAAGYQQGSPLGIALNNNSKDRYLWNAPQSNYYKVSSWNGNFPVFGEVMTGEKYTELKADSKYWTVSYNADGTTTFRKMYGTKVEKEYGPYGCATVTAVDGVKLPRAMLPDEEIISDCREYIAQLATAYTNKKTVPLYFKSITDAVQNCGEISLDGKTFKNVIIAQYGLKAGDKTYIDPALRTDHNENGKTGFDIGGHLRILCEAADVEALRNIIWGVRKPKTVILFANGYRNWIQITDLAAENPKTNNQIVMQDNVDNGAPYWSGIDGSFLTRRKAERAYYADGHHSITTSNHSVGNDVIASKASFLSNMDCMADRIEYNLCSSPSLHIISNTEGFNTRMQNGRIAGHNMVTMLKRDYPGLENNTEKLTIDVVAHSMGFAYAQGMIEILRASTLRDNITWDGYYIIAPENGSAGTVNTGDWKQVWQYGSNLGQGGEDPMWEQDGVAPQSGVRGLENATTNYGRAFIPKTFTPKGFVESHSIGNYGWIFQRTEGVEGYVTRR